MNMFQMLNKYVWIIYTTVQTFFPDGVFQKFFQRDSSGTEDEWWNWQAMEFTKIQKYQHRLIMI